MVSLSAFEGPQVPFFGSLTLVDRPLLSVWTVHANSGPSNFGAFDHPLSPGRTVHFPKGRPYFPKTVHINFDSCEQLTVRTVHKLVNCPNNANSSFFFLKCSVNPAYWSELEVITYHQTNTAKKLFKISHTKVFGFVGFFE